MVGNIGLLASNLSHLTTYHRPQKVILPTQRNKQLLFRVHLDKEKVSDGPDSAETVDYEAFVFMI